MELIDLINHVKANVEAGKPHEAGLLFEGRPSRGVALEMADKYSREKSPGEKLHELYTAESGVDRVEWNLHPEAYRKRLEWHAEREQTLKAQADAWETVWDKLLEVCGPGFSLYTGTGSQIAVQAIDDLIAGTPEVIHIEVVNEQNSAMTGEQFYDEIWKPHFVGILMNEYKDLAKETKAAMETVARLISPRKLTGQDIIDATNYGIGCMFDYWNRVAEKLNAK